MGTLQAKSGCCGAGVRRFGGRRRQCCRCHQTWSIRRKKRGPKARRRSKSLPRLVLLRKMPTGLLAQRYHRSTSNLQWRLRESLKPILAKQSAWLIPEGNLVLVIDGVWSIFHGRCWVLYNMALKPVASNVAWFVDPVLRPGRERVSHWEEALCTIPPETLQRIKAVVSDGLPGVEFLAQRHGWILQLCHRHLSAALTGRLGRRQRQRSIQQPGRGIKAAVHEILATMDDDRAMALCQEVLQLSQHPNCTVGLRRTARFCVLHQHAYRAYLLHPELRLPATTCALESMNRLLRQAISTANTPTSLLRRATAFLRLRKNITCNACRHQQK